MVKESLKKLETNTILESKDKKIFDSIQKIEKGDFKLFRPVGCDKCNSIGYIGRIGIYEFFPMSPEISKATIERKSSQELEDIAVSQGMITLMQDGFLKSVEGLTNISEVMRVALN
jgi:type II secretory ATPase GspE/PulE/Tfp pilus assembly ATPase PilB-like protein